MDRRIVSFLGDVLFLGGARAAIGGASAHPRRSAVAVGPAARAAADKARREECCRTFTMSALCS